MTLHARCNFCRWIRMHGLTRRRGQWIPRRRWWVCRDCGAETEE